MHRTNRVAGVVQRLLGSRQGYLCLGARLRRKSELRFQRAAADVGHKHNGDKDLRAALQGKITRSALHACLKIGLQQETVLVAKL